MSIRDWPAEERPREKLLARGAAALSDAELLALFFGSGRRGRTAVDLGRELIGAHGGIKQLLDLDAAALGVQPGVGPATASRLQAALELGRRYLASEGFLPGYNFPRLPVRAFLPTSRDDGVFINRPRFLALSEFGPRNIIYHEGRKFRVTRTILPVPGVGSPAVVLVSSAYSLPWRKASPRTFSTPPAKTLNAR